MFRKLLVGAIAFSVLGLAACGGGGSGGGSGGGTSVPTLNVSLSATSGSAEVGEGATATGLTVTATSSGHVSTTVVPDLQYDHAVFASVTAVAGATAGTYVVTAQTLPDLGGGEYKGNITFRLCQETACTHVYAGSSVSYAYDVTVKLKDWGTYQRDAGHTAFVHARLDAAKFAKAWDWNVPGHPEIYTTSVATGGNGVYVTSYLGMVYALKEMDGTTNWTYDASSEISSVGGAAYDRGTVYVPTHNFHVVNGSGTEYGIIWAINASDGSYKQDYSFDAQWSALYNPTIKDSKMYYAAGYYGGEVYAYDTLTGTGARKWVASGTGGLVWDQVTPAADDQYVYYYTGNALNAFNIGDGTLAVSIDDPNILQYIYSYGGAPIIGSEGDVIAYSGLPTSARQLTRFNISAESIGWKTVKAYSNTPAIRKGIIYATRNGPNILDAINESDGTVAWSWTAPADDTQFIGNVVVTDNLVFVSTDKNVYAIDLTTHQKVWSYAASGQLAISANFMLYIASSTIGTPNKLTAIKLG